MWCVPNKLVTEGIMSTVELTNKKKRNIFKMLDYQCVLTFVFNCSLTLFLRSLFPEAEKQTRMAALLEKLHAKHNASRPWQETCKVVRQAMVRQTHLSLRENNLNSRISLTYM